jgi:hypothetical protein
MAAVDPKPTLIRVPMTGIENTSTTWWSSSWLLWLIWFSVLVTGTVISDRFLLSVSIGPPNAITALFAYPFFLVAFRKTWRRNVVLPLAAAILHAWYLIIALGLLETIETDHALTAVLIGIIICGTSFAVPATVMLRAFNVVAGGPSGLKTVARVLSWLLLCLIILFSPVLFLGASISAVEFVQANAFREFCKYELDGMPMDLMKKSVPARFIRPQPAKNEFEISSHGRGCIAIETGGRIKVKTLVPESGFIPSLDDHDR